MSATTDSLEPVGRMRTRARRVTAAVGGAVTAAMAAACLAGCLAVDVSQPVLNATDLAATWTSPDGGSITFTGDHRFTAVGLRVSKFGEGCDAGTVSGSGSWLFLNSDGNAGPSLTGYQKGSWVGLTFASGQQSAQCVSSGFELTSWNTGATPGLCLQLDPDSSCAGYVFDKRGG